MLRPDGRLSLDLDPIDHGPKDACGVFGVFAPSEDVAQLTYYGLFALQHRGQESAGIAVSTGKRITVFKDMGLVSQVFDEATLTSLRGRLGIGHTRYSTTGASVWHNAQPTFRATRNGGLALAHNGNLTNTEALKQELFQRDRRHINTDSDSEVLLNVLAHELDNRARGVTLDPDTIFQAVAALHGRARGAYACVAEIAGYGLLAFRDPLGIRPLCYGVAEAENGRTEYLVASESVALEGLGFRLVRDLEPGEAIFIDRDGGFHSRAYDKAGPLSTCIFEYVYFARPDSVIDGASVYDVRLRLGEKLAATVEQQLRLEDIDVVIPIPETSRPSAMQLASRLGLAYREGFIKNRYVGRTFIMPGQAVRQKSVRQKLNAMSIEFKGKNVLLVDDSIVRGTTSREIVQMAREAGANKVFFASAAPPVRYPNVYGIDMPTRSELIAYERDDDAIRDAIGADALVYQSIEAMKQAAWDSGARATRFDASCFDGVYCTGDVTPESLAALEASRKKADEARRAADAAN